MSQQETTLSSLPSLFEIYEEFQNGNSDVLSLVNKYLEEQPDSIDAILLKVEICLSKRVIREYGLISKTLAQLPVPDGYETVFDRLWLQRDELVKSMLDKGRTELTKNNLRDALSEFDRAVSLAATDPAITFACGMALVKWKPSDKKMELPSLFGSLSINLKQNPELLRWHDALNRYFQQSIQFSSKGDDVYKQSILCFSQHANDTNTISMVSVELLLGLCDLDQEAQLLFNKTEEQIVANSLDAVQLMLHVGQNREASKLLKLIEHIAPLKPELLILSGDLLRLTGHSNRASLHYQKLLKKHRKRQSVSRNLTSKLQNCLERSKVTCPSCGKDLRVISQFGHKCLISLENCPTCQTGLRQQELLADRYALPLTDMLPLAHLGLAELLIDQQRQSDALIHIDSALRSIPPNRKAVLQIKLLRSRLHQEEERISPAARISAQIDKDGLTEGTLYHIEQINNQTPHDWFELSVASRLRICKALLNNEYFLHATRLVNHAFTDKPTRPSVVAFVKGLHQQIRLRVDALLSQAQTAISEHFVEDAVQIITQAIELTPDDPRLYLARGNARILLGHDAPALEDLYHALNMTEAFEIQTTARKQIAFLLEQRWDLDGANNVLDSIGYEDAEITEIRTRAERRRKAEPLLFIQPVDSVLTDDTLMRTPISGYYSGLFAVAVRQISKPNKSLSEWNSLLRTASFEFTQILGAFRNIALDVTFAIRIICTPYPTNPERGEIKVVLLVHTTEQGETLCRERTLNIYQDIVASLPLVQDNIYVFEPIVDEGELNSLLLPFEPVQLAEIVRRETDPARDSLYTVSPFTPGTVDMHNLFWTLLRQPAPSMVSIQLKPTHMYEWDLYQSVQNIPETPLDSEDNPVDVAGFLVTAVETNLKQMEEIHQNQINMRYLENPFVLRVNIAGSAGTSSLLPYMAASALMGPLHNQGKTGGYEIRHTTNYKEHESAYHNLIQVDVEHWGYTTAPNGKHKLRYIVGEPEAASMFHFPIPTTEGVPGMRTQEGRPVPPPAGMASSGTVLGFSTTRAANAIPVKVVIADSDRRRHLYVVGKTGTGKSTLLSTIVLQDILAGKSVCLIDPHGDLVNDILLRIPTWRADDVIYIDPADDEYPIGLNVLNPTSEDDKPQIVNAFIALIQRMYDPNNSGITGPIFQSFVRNAFLAVMSVPNGSLIDAYRIISETGYSKKFIPFITDPVVRNFWEQENSRTSQSDWRKDIVIYTTSKFSRFVDDPVLRRIVSQSRNSIDWFGAIQSQKIILVNLAKGRIGTETSQFLGLLILGEILQAVFRRGQLPTNQRRDLSIIIDEVQNYSTPLLSTIIAEGRKFNVNLTIANQYLHQLDNGLKEAVFGNVGTLAAMRVGIDDATALARELYPIFSVDDLINLPQYTAAIKLLVNGMSTRPFTMRTSMLTQQPNQAVANHIIQLCQQRYGTPIALVEQELTQKFEK